MRVCEEETMETVNDLIGNEYKKWVPGDIITISTPTGSGKTTFILKTLLQWAAKKGWAILYLVNRKVLRDQIQQRIRTEIQAQWESNTPSVLLCNYISVWTYQEIEEKLKKSPSTWLDAQLAPYAVAVFDECHYFCVDSVFNPATVLSWNYLTSRFKNNIQIFMSATIEPMWYYLMWLKDPNNRTGLAGYQQIRHLVLNYCYDYPDPNIREEYSAIYDYINLHHINSEAELPALIQKAGSNKKWLIFIDSINKGKKLCSFLRKTYKDEVIFIHAAYKNDLETYERILELKIRESISKQIVIATSVMDNGISFKDRDLQNIVVFADMKESFIQMLGRKRVDNEKVNLYICRRDSKYFSSRIKDVDATLECYGKYARVFEETVVFVPKLIKQQANDPEDKNTNKQADKKDNATTDAKSTTDVVSYEPVYRYDKQQEVLSDILNNEQTRKQMKRVCYIDQGMIFLSPFSVKRLCDMRLFYTDMKDKLQTDENAFLVEQAKWLGFSEGEITSMLAQSGVERCEFAISSICKIIETDYYHKELNKEQNIEMVRKINAYVRMLLTVQNGFSAEEIRQIKEAVKGDRTFSVDRFNCFISKFNGIPYKMTKKGQSWFWIDTL